MGSDATELLKQALELSADERAALADSLVDSLDGDLDATAPAAWTEEISKRLEELNSGAVKTVSWDEARRLLQARIRR